jgi:hypothetical protein
MTLQEFDALKTGDRVKFTNPVTLQSREGTVKRILSDEILITWDDNTSNNKQELEIVRAWLRTFYHIYSTIEVLK